MEKYNPQEIEEKWQKIWEEKSLNRGEDFSEKPKHFHLIEFPFPSGAGLHVGHVMSQGASDAYCRMKRLQGYNVMFPIGYDAFGLPTENFAIKNKIKPQVATSDNIKNFRKQMKSLGLSFDWSRELSTADPNYYRWTQWIFLQLYTHAIVNDKLVKVADDDSSTERLAYQAKIAINWCPSCKIGLANEEVISGKCERCGAETVKKLQKQWMLRITKYADRLIKDLDTVDYLEHIKTQQINWIGKSTGTNIIFKLKNSDKKIEVFTTRADTLFGCTYLVLAPENELINELKSQCSNENEIDKYIESAKKKSDLERTELQKEKTGVILKDLKAINPINNEEVLIYVADYVLANYGTGAVMAVPAHDDRDYEFAKKYDILIKEVISPEKGSSELDNGAFTQYGRLINSEDFSGMKSSEAKSAITQKLASNNAGSFSTNYKLRDWVFSRQHYWGEPIPIIHCDRCGNVPLNETDLPLLLPDVDNYEPTENGQSPLSAVPGWVNVTCPKCGGKAKRETDTMPNWAGSSWYFLAYTMNQNQRLYDYLDNNDIFTNSSKELKYWTPVDLYNGGNEHTTLHLLYSRFWHKFLYDLGIVPTSEPYHKRIAHGIILGPDGRKMSKSFGNVINPDDIVKQFGADSTRAYIMFIGPYDQESAWSQAGVQGVFRFMNRVYNNFRLLSEKNDEKGLLIKLNQSIVGITQDLESFHMNTVVSKLMELNNEIEKVGHISAEAYQKFLQLLFPVAPHLASELWEMAEFDSEIVDSVWPKADPRYLVPDTIEIVVQINGKVRDKLEVDSNIDNKSLEDLALKSSNVMKYTSNNKIAKIITIPKKLVSIVLE